MRVPSLWPLVIVALPIATLFGPALVSDTSFALRDAAHFYYPLFEWTTREWAAGRVPLWNPHENCGVPVVADATSSVFYPGKLVFALPLDFALRYKLYIVLHVALAAAAAYYLSRRWGQSSAAAALAVVAYALGGSVLFQYCNVVFLVGAAWLPVAILAADRMLLDGRVRSALLLAAVLALMILGGDPQTAFHTLLVTALYAVILCRRHKTNCAPDVWLRPRTTLGSRLGLLSIAAVSAGLLAAVQVLPSMEATQLSERATFNRPRNIYEAAEIALSQRDRDLADETRTESITRGLIYGAEAGSHHDRIYDFSIGPWRLIELVWPNIGGRMFPTNRRWMSLIPAEGRIWSPTLYMGLLPLVFGVFACFACRHEPRAGWLAWTAVLFAVGSFGYYGLGWLLQELRVLASPDGTKTISPAAGGLYWLAVVLLPSYVYFRYPAKLLTVAALALCQLAGFGFERAFSRRSSGLSRTLVMLGSGSLAAAFLVWLFGSLVLGQLRATDATLGPFDALGAKHDCCMALLQTSAVALAAAWLLSRAWQFPANCSRWQWLAALLTAAELTAANAWLIVTAPADLWRQPAPVAASILARNESDEPAARLPSRVYRGNLAGWRPQEFKQDASPARLVALTRFERDTLFPKFELLSGVDLVETYSSIKLADYESLLFVAKERGPRQPDGSFLPQPTALRLLNTEFLLLPDRQQPAFANRVFVDHESLPDGAALWRMQRTLPRAWIVRDVVKLPPLSRPRRMAAIDQRSEEVLFPDLRARDFATTAVIETDAKLTFEAGQARGPQGENIEDACRITHYGPQRIVVQTALKQPGLLVLGDAWYPGWRTSVKTSGKTRAATIHRTNRVLRGVWLDAGSHEVEFRYRSVAVLVGGVISACSCCLLGIYGCCCAIRTRTSQLPGEGSRGAMQT